jgi:hypothetical protein
VHRCWRRRWSRYFQAMEEQWQARRSRLERIRVCCRRVVQERPRRNCHCDCDQHFRHCFGHPYLGHQGLDSLL